MKLQCCVDPGIGLLERIAYAEDCWIDVLVARKGFNVQLITLVANVLLFLRHDHRIGLKGVKGFELCVRGWGQPRSQGSEVHADREF
jgi:hypothetical protein